MAKCSKEDYSQTKIKNNHNKASRAQSGVVLSLEMMDFGAGPTTGALLGVWSPCCEGRWCFGDGLGSPLLSSG